ncbi:hypothetical protein DJ568_16715 [Mucilaginibacter hurinus]|uniref:Lipocalin-like domain-containing protein n=1 Tax=Mucilaginibacter hurinus TaxID=2201324 RepID=A0A367GJM2_9SPHI|nr:hypothetical protein [Mucilaginibacter hurinus]RCH53677.1 hypothetical protein DJ568_16715 [Mucilaginibacter hurinus]
MRRIFKYILPVLLIQVITGCSSESEPEPSLAGKWNITSAVGNNDLHWTGSLTLKQNGTEYKGVFIWDSVDGVQSGTDSVSGRYNDATRVLTMKSVVITGNIEPVTYTADISDDGQVMDGIWTGSSDGSVEHPGVWTAQKDQSNQ